jgi:CrcB protein
MINLLVALGGAFGALARFGVANLLNTPAALRFPYATLLVNVTGSFLLGLVLRGFEGWPNEPGWRAFLAIGFCGAFTTFSTFSYENMRLLQERQYFTAFGNIVGSVVLCILAVLAGFAIAQRFTVTQ